MNDDELLSDLEKRLHAWRPADLPAGLHARLRSACPAPRRVVPWLRPALAGACALAVGVALLVAGRFAPTPREGVVSTPGASPEPPRTDAPEAVAESRWVLGQSLTMNIYTGVPTGIAPTTLRLDREFAAQTGLLPVRSTDGILPLKVDCQF